MTDSIKLPPATIVRRQDITPVLMKLWLKPSVPFDFKPGQYCTIGVDGIERPYSIVSKPGDEALEFYIELISVGTGTARSLTPKLWQKRVGDTVTIRPKAKGVFLFEEGCDTHVMVATVTCVAPYVSIIRSYVSGYYRKNFEKPLYLFHGASYHDEFGYRDELEELARTKKIIYVPTVSRPKEERNAPWKGQFGRVNLILPEYFSKFGIRPEQNTMVYVCGNGKMVEALTNKTASPDAPTQGLGTPESPNGRRAPIGWLVEAGFRNKVEKFY